MSHLSDWLKSFPYIDLCSFVTIRHYFENFVTKNSTHLEGNKCVEHWVTSVKKSSHTLSHSFDFYYSSYVSVSAMFLNPLVLPQTDNDQSGMLPYQCVKFTNYIYLYVYNYHTIIWHIFFHCEYYLMLSFFV